MNDPILLVQYKIGPDYFTKSFSSYLVASNYYGLYNSEKWFSVEAIKDKKSFTARMAVARKDSEEHKHKEKLKELRKQVDVLLSQIQTLEEDN